MFRRWIIAALLMSFTSTAFAIDPFLMLLLRMVRDQAISATIEAGVGMLRQEAPPSAPTFGYALPIPPIPHGEEEQRLRTLIDESFLHLIPAQRDAVFAGIQKILNDPRHAQIKSQITAEFALKAKQIREAYRSLDKLPFATKQALATQAKQSYASLGASERKELLEVLQSRMLPIPRDFNDLILAEFSTVVASSSNESAYR